MTDTMEIHHELTPAGVSMAGMATHKKNLRHGGTASRNYPWPLLLIAAPAAVAIWSGWVGLGGMCGFGPVNLLPGIGDGLVINTAITLPVGVEAYGTYALAAWLGSRNASERTREWARKSAIGALALGCLGQITYHLMAAAGWARAPWYVVMLVACLPVVTVYFGATLTHLILADRRAAAETPEVTTDSTLEAVPVVTTETPAVDTTPDAPVDTTAEPSVVTTETAAPSPHEVTTDPPAEVTAEVTTDPGPAVTARRRRIDPARATDDQLADLILEHCDDPAGLNPYRVCKILKEQCNNKKVGDARGARLVELVQRKHRASRVVAIGERG